MFYPCSDINKNRNINHLSGCKLLDKKIFRHIEKIKMVPRRFELLMQHSKC